MPDSSQQGPDLAPGRKLGNYTIVRKIGEGGMGAVYEAHQAGINRRVALKVLPKALRQNQVFLERFLREAQSAGALNHPNIVTVYEVVQDQGHYFFSMEYVDGHTLREQLKRTGRMSADEALKIVRKVAQALHYAWTEARIIHRDIKPDNIMLTRQGEIKVADLGLAKSTAQDTTVTADGTGIGTPAYMSPEQSRGAKDIDCRADIYSLGITLFQMVTARLPFEAETPYAVIAAHLEQPLPDPKSLNPDLPDAVSALVQRMCAKDPSQRYETPGQLVDEIDAISQPGAAGPTQSIRTEAFRQQPTIPISQRRRRVPNSRSRAPVILGVVAGLAVVSGLGYMMFGNGSSGGPSSTTTTTRTTINGAGNGDLLARAQGMLDYAMEYAQKHPSEFSKIIDMFEEVRIECKGTACAMKATVQIEEWRKTWDAAGSAEIEKRKALVARHLADTDFGKARAVWQDFPKDLLTDATREKVNAEIAKVEAAVRAFAQNLKRQAGPFLAKMPGRLTGDDIATLAALKAKAERPPGGLDAAGKAALAELAGQIGQALAAYQEHLAAEQAKAFDVFWGRYEGLIKDKLFDEAVAHCEATRKVFVVPPLGGLQEGPPKGGTTNATNDWPAKLKLLAEDARLLKGLFASVTENLPHLKGKTIRIGGMAMTVSDVKDGKVYVRQDAAEMAFGMDKLDDETTLMLALLGEKEPGLILRKKALFAFYYGRETEIAAKLKEAAEAGTDVSFYLSRLRPVLVVTSVPPGSSVAIEVNRDGAWEKVTDDTQKTPARCEVPGHGSYRVKVSKKDYLTATREITVREVGELKLVFSLKKVGPWPPVRDGLVLHYSFDKAGERADDLSGKGNHGTVHGATWTAKGKVGGAYEFDGKNDYLSVADSVSLRPTPAITVAAWVKWNPTRDSQAVIVKGLDGDNPLDWALTVTPTGRVRPHVNVNGQWTQRDGEAILAARTWYHLAATYDGFSLRSYVNGVPDSSCPIRGRIHTSMHSLKVGAYAPVAGRRGKHHFSGPIDEVMVYNRALSEAEIRALAEPGRATEIPGEAGKYNVEALLAAGFEVPKEAKDKYGNPIRKGTNATTDLPLEIRHKKTGMHLVFIPAGEFMMGSPETERGRVADREGPLHRVRITKPFYIGKYETTQPEWLAAMGNNPSHFRDDKNPVEMVNWFDCQDFIKKLNAQFPVPNPQIRFALPAEAQWEYACRAGTRTRFYFGDDLDHRELASYAWFHENSGGRAHPSGEKKPNAWSLYDTAGNVWEWCQDWYGSYAREAVSDPTGPERGTSRLYRGGSWGDIGADCRAACRRTGTSPSFRHSSLGCRVVLAIPAGRPQGLPIREGLVGCWMFDEGRGDKAADLSGKANHATVKGATWSRGEFGMGLRFDGINDHVDASNSPALTLTRAVTIETLVRASSFDTDHMAEGIAAYVVSKSQEYTNEANYNLRLTKTGKVVFTYYDGTGHNNFYITKPALSKGKWHHIVVTYRYSTYDIGVFIDGVRVAGSWAEGAGYGGHPNSPKPVTTANRLSFGAAVVFSPGWGGKPGDTVCHFKGQIDLVRLYDRALSADEVKILANPQRWGAVQRPAGAMPPGREALVLYYPFDKAGDRAEDRSGKGNHGEVHKAKWTAEGKFGGAHEFDGKSAYIQRDYAPESDVFPSTTAFSAAAWFKTSASWPEQPVVLGPHFAGIGDGYHLILSTRRLQGRIRWQVSAHPDLSSRLPVNDGRWHQAVGVWGGAQSHLYVDGVLQGSNRAPGPIPYDNLPPFRIGHLKSPPHFPDSELYFNGTIDEVMVFNRVLSADEVKALFEWKPKLEAGAAPR